MNTARGPRASPSDPGRRHRHPLTPAASAAFAFAALTAALTAGGLAPLPGDSSLTQAAVDHRPGAVVAALQVVTATGTGFAPYLLAATAGLILAGRRPRTRTAQVVLACVGWLALGQAVRFGLMTLIARPRPPEADWLTHASRHAYPSGHATTSAMAAGLIVAALISRRPRGHRAWIALTLAWAAAVGASRVWLGVHWTTDVIAGWLLALTWTALAVAAAARIHTEGAA